MGNIGLGTLIGVAFMLGLAAAAQPAGASDGLSAARPISELSAQQRRPARIIIRPRRYLYPYPGPSAVRHCTSWLQPEYRPSGPVIVPQMRCWWVPG
jgi:hypothetical protein